MVVLLLALGLLCVALARLVPVAVLVTVLDVAAAILAGVVLILHLTGR